MRTGRAARNFLSEHLAFARRASAQTASTQQNDARRVQIMTTRTVLGAIAGLAMVLGHATVATAGDASRDPRVAHGRYLVTIGGCNDCHTAGYPESGGKVPEEEWLTGVPVGFQGPWGTSYPANLRRVVSGMSEAEWVVHARKERMPPMPEECRPALGAISQDYYRARIPAGEVLARVLPDPVPGFHIAPEDPVPQWPEPDKCFHPVHLTHHSIDHPSQAHSLRTGRDLQIQSG